MYKNLTYSELASLTLKISELFESDDYIQSSRFRVLCEAFTTYWKILNNAVDTDTTDSIFRVNIPDAVAKLAK